ncbi:MAG: NosD domain-containing protein [Bacteroidota bacterium]|nr:NosD domain-containing protein [Bacteroidota bacterium]
MCYKIVSRVIITAVLIMAIVMISNSQSYLDGPPANVTVREVSVSGSTIYAADAYRIMKSTNSGIVWNPLGIDVEEPLVVTSNPTDANHVVIGKKDTVIYSSDGGSTWSDLTPVTHPLRLKRSPDHITHVYLGSKYSSGKSSLRTSRYNGASLSSYNSSDNYFRDVAATNVTDIAVRAGSGSQEIWVTGTYDDISTANIPQRKRGVWASTTGGDTWEHIKQDIDATAIGVYGTNRLVGTKSGKLLIKEGDLPGFIEVPGFSSAKAGRINVIQRVGQRWVVGAKKGLFRMTDVGWQSAAKLEGRQVFSIQVVNNTIYAASDKGIYSSTDGGDNWILITQTSLRGAKVTGVAAANNIVLAVQKDGKYDILSRFNGTGWSKIMDPFIQDEFTAQGVIFHPVNSNIAFAFGKAKINGARAVIYKSTDAGENWTRKFLSSLKGSIVEGITYSQTHQKFFAFGKIDKLWNQVYGVYINYNVFFSSDGDSWAKTEGVVDGGKNTVTSLVAHPTNNLLFAAMPSGNLKGAYRTTNGGDLWMRTTPIGKSVFTLAIGYSNPQNYYAGYGNFILRVAVGGNDSCRIGKFSGLSQLALRPQTDDNLYALVKIGGRDSIVRHTGGTILTTGWTSAGSRIPAKNIHHISFSTTSPYNLYVGSDSGVHYMSTSVQTVAAGCPSGFTKTSSIGIGEVINVNGTMKIDPGKTLVVDEGAVFLFSPGSRLIVEGQLYVQGTAINKVQFKAETPSQRWGGIYIDKEAKAHIEHAEISGAMVGILGIRSDIQIENTKITDCLVGTGFYGSVDNPPTMNSSTLSGNAWGVVTLNNSSPVLTNNVVSGGQKGILIESSNPLLSGNTISDNTQVGVVIYGSGYCRFSDITTSRSGSNRIEGNQITQVLAVKGTAFLGYQEGTLVNSFGGGNIIQSADPDAPLGAIVEYSQLVNLKVQPTLSKLAEDLFLVDETSRIIEDPIDPDPEPQRLLLLAYNDRRNGLFQDAIVKYKLIIRDYPALSQANQALNELRETYQELIRSGSTTGIDQLKAYLESLSSHSNAEIVRSASLYAAREYASYSDPYTALEKYQQALNQQLDSDLKISALLSKMTLEGFELDAEGDAEETFLNMKQQFPNDERTQLAQLQLQIMQSDQQEISGFNKNGQFRVEMRKLPKSKKQLEGMQSIPSAFGLQQNYPNPFNPSTLIKYQLPKVSNVEITIYNIFGQEVNMLVNGIQDAGYYEVVWNSDNNTGNQAASGVYFYRISAIDITNPSNKFLQVRKMMLIK